MIRLFFFSSTGKSSRICNNRGNSSCGKKSTDRDVVIGFGYELILITIDSLHTFFFLEQQLQGQVGLTQLPQTWPVMPQPTPDTPGMQRNVGYVVPPEVARQIAAAENAVRRVDNFNSGAWAYEGRVRDGVFRPSETPGQRSRAGSDLTPPAWAGMDAFKTPETRRDLSKTTTWCSGIFCNGGVARLPTPPRA